VKVRAHPKVPQELQGRTVEKIQRGVAAKPEGPDVEGQPEGIIGDN